ncbi:HPP family protein [Planctomycetota bacterium]
MLKAKDIMTKQVVYVRTDTPVLDAMNLMVENTITGIPVIDDDMTLVGMVSEQDILRLFHTFIDEKDRAVSDFMTQPAVYFEEDEPALDICYCLRDHTIRRVPITSNGKVVGIISRSDIIKYILVLSEQDAQQAVGESK